MKYEKLFEAGRIGRLRIKNRIVMAPMHTAIEESDGTPGERLIRYYEERARGGAGLIITEACGIDDEYSATSARNLYLTRKEHVAPFERLTEAVHNHDCLIFAQLHHGGATVNPEFIGGKQPVGPSEVPAVPGGRVPRALTKEEIKGIVLKFIRSAELAALSGYDGVVLHMAHGYLLTEMASPHYNKRTDEYGGSFENRMRIFDEIIAGIREKLGAYPISVRMCGDEMTPWMDDMMDLEYGLRCAKHFEEQGIDVIDISNGSAGNPNANCEPYSYSPGWKKHVARAFKEVLSIPVIATNTIKDPEFAESLLEEGICDFVAVGRGHFADPEFAKKAREGRSEEIRNCIGCMYCRERVIWKGVPVRCTVNPRIGCEYIYDRKPPKDGGGRSVAVIGAGPGGMQAAVTLADRGFAVTVYEKSDRTGGRMNLADKPRYKDNIQRLIDTMELEMKLRGVTLKLNTEASPELVKKDCDPVGVFVCTGAEWIVPAVKGADRDNVTDPEGLFYGKSCGAKSAVVIGCGNTGIECVERLQDDGTQVTMIDMLDEVGRGMFPVIKNDLLERVNKHHPTVLLRHELVEITENGVVARDMENGEEKKIDADLIVLSIGSRPNAELIDSFRKSFDKTLVIGSAVADGRINDAIREGYTKAYAFE